MADYDSDSSGAEDLETNILLGYASKEPTSDDFSQLGGRPTWLDLDATPSGALAKCKICNARLSLLLQLNGDLPDRFPEHERRLYVFSCRKKACRRKEGSVRTLRAVRVSVGQGRQIAHKDEGPNAVARQPLSNLGETLFGAKSPTPAQANPFAPGSTAATNANPFSSTKPAEQQVPTNPQAKGNDDLAQSFADKVRISSLTTTPASSVPSEPWTDDPSPYPSLHLDADKEYLEATLDSANDPSNARVDTEAGSSTAAEEKALFESSMDKTFQRFADRLAQNPEQVLRYEFGGEPLLYSKSDAVGELLSPDVTAKIQTSSSRNGTPSLSASRMPRCSSCGAARVFELQLTPHAITELEVDETGIYGMDWGTIIVGVCSEDCAEKGKAEGEVGYVEEWVGVQWEESSYA